MLDFIGSHVHSAPYFFKLQNSDLFNATPLIVSSWHLGKQAFLHKIDLLDLWSLDAQEKFQDSAQYIYIRTVSSKRLLSTLMIQFKLVYGSFGQSKMHSTLDFCPRPAIR